jgi:hypothetical protein
MLPELDLFTATELLKNAMTEAGCLTASIELLQLDPPTRFAPINAYRLKPDYSGRFSELAEGYEEAGRFTEGIARFPDGTESAGARLSLEDYLKGRWRRAFRDIRDLLRDEKIHIRGVVLDNDRQEPMEMSPVRATSSMELDGEGLVWEGPATPNNKQPRRWKHLSVNWEELLKYYPRVVTSGDDDNPQKVIASGMENLPSASRLTPLQQAIVKIDKEVYPNGPPTGTSVKKRRRKIIENL